MCRWRAATQRRCLGIPAKPTPVDDLAGRYTQSNSTSRPESTNACQLQQRPSPADGGLFKWHCFRLCQPRERTFLMSSSACRAESRYRSPLSMRLVESMTRSNPGIANSRIWKPRTTLSEKSGAEWAPFTYWGIRSAPAWTVPRPSRQFARFPGADPGLSRN